MTDNEIIYSVKFSWLRKLVLPYLLIIFIITTIALFLGEGDYEIFFWIFLTVAFSNYLFFIQFECTEIVMTKYQIHISYPLSLFLKKKQYNFNEVKKIQFSFDPSPYGTPIMKIFKMDGSIKKHHCAYERELKELLILLQDYNVVIENNN